MICVFLSFVKPFPDKYKLLRHRLNTAEYEGLAPEKFSMLALLTKWIRKSLFGETLAHKLFLVGHRIGSSRLLKPWLRILGFPVWEPSRGRTIFLNGDHLAAKSCTDGVNWKFYAHKQKKTDKIKNALKRLKPLLERSWPDINSDPIFLLNFSLLRVLQV